MQTCNIEDDSFEGGKNKANPSEMRQSRSKTAKDDGAQRKKRSHTTVQITNDRQAVYQELMGGFTI